MSAPGTVARTGQTTQLVAVVSQFTHANQALVAEQQKTAQVMQKSLDQTLATIDALTRENGSLKAKLVETDARVDEQQKNFEAQLKEMQKLIEQQGQTIQGLTARTTTLESMVAQLKHCASKCKAYINMAYSTIWNGQKTDIPDPI